jgi:hypothetical protein
MHVLSISPLGLAGYEALKSGVNEL